MFRVIGIVLMVLAIALIAVPRFTDCQSQGKAIEISGSETVPMPCHWSGIAEIGVAIPMYIVGAVMTTSRRQKTLALLSALGIVLGGLAIAFPTRLIGVCRGPVPMLCETLMKPVLVLMGGLAITASGSGAIVLTAKTLSRTSGFMAFILGKNMIAQKGV